MTNFKLLKKYDDEERYRIDYKEIRNVNHELADRFQFIRSRAKDLKRKFIRDAEFARKRFYNCAILACSISVLIIIIMFIDEDIKISEIVAVASIISATIFGLVNSVGLQQQYQALFSAAWETEALITRIDSKLLELSFDRITTEKLADHQLENIKSFVSQCSDDLSNILIRFGEKYSPSLKELVFKGLGIKDTAKTGD